MDRIRLIKDIRVIKEDSNPEVLLVKATGVASLKNIIAPALVSSENYDMPADDGIYELDFVLGSTGEEEIEVEMEVDVIYKLKKIPGWVKGIKVRAEENSDIELI